MSSHVRRLDPFRASTVLVVESRPSVTDAPDACKLLRGLGYRAETAPSSRAALDCVNRQPGHFAALLSDVLLPGMDGGELAERLRGSGTPVVLMIDRGRDGPLAGELLAAYPGVPSVEKPLTLGSLYAMLAVRLGLPPMAGARRVPSAVRPPRRSGERHTIH